MANPLAALYRNFGHPRGFLGWVAGQIMAVENRARNRWAVELLDLRPDDRVLEIGFGPGLALAEVLARTRAPVAGVDASDVMVRMAAKRNAAAVRDGRLDLRLGDAAALPFPDGAFDAVLAVNVLHHADGAAPALGEVRRVLAPGGRVAVVEQPHGAVSDEDVRARVERFTRLLRAAGFERTHAAIERSGKAPTVAVLARAPAEATPVRKAGAAVA